MTSQTGPYRAVQTMTPTLKPTLGPWRSGGRSERMRQQVGIEWVARKARMAKLADARDLKSYHASQEVNLTYCFKIVYLHICEAILSLHNSFTLSHCWLGVRRNPRWLNSTLSSVARFTSTNDRTAAFGSAPAISQAGIAGPARRKIASPRQKRSPRIGICNYEENSAAEKSKQRKLSAKHRNYSFVNTTSSRRASAA